MNERPILFSAQMVRAILDGRKTQTRMVVKPQPRPGPVPGLIACYQGDWAWRRSGFSFTVTNKPNGPDDIAEDCPHGVPGDRLWVRETLRQRRNEGQFTHGIQHPDEPPDLLYAADDMEVDQSKDPANWSYPREVVPAIHMPRWASRITLEIVSVRVERLQDISEEDAIAEGAPGPQPHYAAGEISEIGPNTHRDGFRDLWQSINGAESWTANPWVWAITFKRINA